MARVDEDTGTVVVRRRLEAHPASVSVARRAVTTALRDLGRPDLTDDAALAVTELVTNALVHAGTPMELIVSHTGPQVLVEVGDDNPRLPTLRHHAELAGTGRGLHLVQQLTADWGARPRPPGKTVWFALGAARSGVDDVDDVGAGAGVAPVDAALDPRDLEVDLEALMAAFPDVADDPPADPPTVGQGAPAPAVVEVELLDMPLLLHAAWQLQADSVLREYLLTRLSGDDGQVADELQTHAAVHEAVALLHEHVPAPDLGDHPEELMAAAVEPLVSAERLVIPVPERAVAQFARMDAVLDAAMELADAGALLTPPTQPEVRSFRRWLCDQVRGQHAGGAPVSWRRQVLAVESRRPPPAWDPTGVTTSEQALVAAEDTNRIVALSAAAVRLLGYRSADELVGRRLVEIIPVRYRQAHVAGLTLHLFAGRSPLLGHPVTVPALRADGSELLVELLVEVVLLPEGRRVFVAEMAAVAETAEPAEAQPAVSG